MTSLLVAALSSTRNITEVLDQALILLLLLQWFPRFVFFKCFRYEVQILRFKSIKHSK